jgi:DNA-binding NarL/FixJ family response regulator
MTQARTTPQVRVVIVEDDDFTRASLSAAVSATAGFVLAAAFDRAQAAIDWFGAHGADVLLTDLGLPDGSGVDVIRTALALWPECDIMVISMFGDDKNVLASIEAGATGYLLKDGDQFDVARALRDLRNGGSPMSPMIARKVLQRALRRDVPPGTVAASQAVSGAAALPGMALTRRETETLDLIARGYTYEEVARLLSVSLSTVQTYIRAIYGKLAVHSRSQAVFEAHKLGLLAGGLLAP